MCSSCCNRRGRLRLPKNRLRSQGVQNKLREHIWLINQQIILERSPIMRLFICCVALVFATFVSAQTVTDEMKADTRKFLELTGALKIGEQMGNAISQQIINSMR